VLGGIPTRSVKPPLKVPGEEQPTAKQTSVTPNVLPQERPATPLA
jgi:hypothetical protein